MVGGGFGLPPFLPVDRGARGLPNDRYLEFFKPDCASILSGGWLSTSG